MIQKKWYIHVFEHENTLQVGLNESIIYGWSKDFEEPQIFKF